MDERYRDHAWFVSFAPYDEPILALAIFIENGGKQGATLKLNIAKAAYEHYLTPKTAESSESIKASLSGGSDARD